VFAAEVVPALVVVVAARIAQRCSRCCTTKMP
jgi:hypothetical protein